VIRLEVGPDNNVYGNKTPIEIEKDIHKQRDWSRIVGEESSRPQREPVPGPSRQPPPDPLPEGEGLESEEEVQDSLEPSDDDGESVTVSQLCQEGGVAFQHFLISRSIPLASVAHADYESEDYKSHQKNGPTETSFVYRRV